MDDKRSHKRSEIRLRCPCRTLDGVPLEIELIDLSERGCRARCVGFPLEIGQALRIFPEGCNAFTATVRRHSDGISAIEFDRELPHAVYERMRAYAPLPEEIDDETRHALTEEDQPEASSQTPAETQVSPPTEPSAGRTSPQPYGSLLTTGKKPTGKRIAIF